LGYRVLALFVLTVFNAFFSAAEVALLSVRPARMKALAEEGNLGAQAALSLIGNMERMIALSQVGITLASLGMGWAGEEAIYDALVHSLAPGVPDNLEWLLRGASFAASFLFLTFVIVVLGEVVPKNLAVEKAERMAVLTSPAMLVCYRILEPFVKVVEKASTFFSKAFGLKGSSHGGGAHSAEEIKYIVSSSEEQGHLEAFEQDSIHRLLDLRQLVAREVMVPRGSVVSLPSDASLDEVLRTMAEHNYSRVPVYEGQPENIVGVIHYRDLLRVWRDRRFANDRRRTARPFHVSDWMVKPLIVPETKPLNDLIGEFRAGHKHMAVVVDEFGTITGVVTLEDVLEEVFGEIEDEHDDRRRPPKAEDASVEVEGTIPIRDLETQYGIELPFETGFETLAGFLLSRLGHLPTNGESIEEDGRRFTVLTMERNRIARVRIEKVEAAPVEAA
jgi:CBS domain containing-hemolysin-like protein